MQLKPEEISKIIRAQIKHYENAIEQSETGTVIMVGDGIARASGLEKCMAGELLQFDNGEYGMAQNLEENTVSIVLLGSDVGIKEGSTVKRTGKIMASPTGTDTTLPVRLTVLPSLIPTSEPSRTMETVFSSRFWAMPYSPFSNWSSSPAMHFSRPLARAMPSPTRMTVPTSLCSMTFS